MMMEYEAKAREIAHRHHTSLERLRGPDKHARLMPAKREIAQMLRGRGWSLPRIAKFMGKSDHTTIRNWLRDDTCQRSTADLGSSSAPSS